jgi:hypothetical protein
MASKQGIEAGGAFVRIFADDSPLRRTLKDAANQMKSFATPLVGASKILGGGLLAAGAAAVAATRSFANYGDSVGDAAARTGLSAETLSELGYAAKLSGSDMATLEAGFKTFTKGLVSGGNVKALETLGLDAATLKAQSPDQQLQSIMTAFQGIQNPTQKAGLAMQVFGKAGAQMIPLLSASSEELAGMRDEAKKFGMSLSADQVDSAAKFNDAIDKMGMALQGVANTIGAALAPLLTWMADSVLIAAESFIAWLKEITKFVGSSKTAFATLQMAWAATTEFFGNAFSYAVQGISSALVVMQTTIEGVFDTVATNIQIVWAKAMQAMTGATFSMVQKISKPLADVLRGAGLDSAANFIQGAATGIGVGAPMIAAEQSKESAKLGTELEKRRQQRELDQAAMLANIQEDAARARSQRTQAVVDAQTKLAESMAADQKRASEEAAKRAERAQLEAGVAFAGAGGGMETAGTFAAQAIAGLGAQSLQQDMLNALNKVAANTGAIVDEVANGGLQ